MVWSPLLLRQASPWNSSLEGRKRDGRGGWYLPENWRGIFSQWSWRNSPGLLYREEGPSSILLELPDKTAEGLTDHLLHPIQLGKARVVPVLVDVEVGGLPQAGLASLTLALLAGFSSLPQRGGWGRLCRGRWGLDFFLLERPEPNLTRLQELILVPASRPNFWRILAEYSSTL